MVVHHQNHGIYSSSTRDGEFDDGRGGKIKNKTTANDSATDILPGDASRKTIRNPINVCVCLTPMNKLELSRRSKKCIRLHQRLTDNGKRKITVDSPLDGDHQYSFDQVFGDDTSEQILYRDAVSSLAKKMIEGYNCSLVVCGYSYSEKNKILLGSKHGMSSSSSSRRTDERKEGSNHFTSNQDGEGIISRVASDLFQWMKEESSQDLQFTVKVSFMEIYLDQIRDLLNPSVNNLGIRRNGESEEDGGEWGSGNIPVFPKIYGLSEVCCITAMDIVSLVKRGHAYRVVRQERNRTDFHLSHTVLSITIEQKNIITERTIKNVMVIADVAGKELDGTLSNAQSSRGDDKTKQGSMSSLVRALKELDSNKNTSSRRVFDESTLLQILQNTLGGDSFCTFLLTASPASSNIKFTLNTMQFGMMLQDIANQPTIQVQASTKECSKELERFKMVHNDLIHLLQKIDEEMQKIKQISNDRGIEAEYWDTLNRLISFSSNFSHHKLTEDVDNQSHTMSLEEEIKLEREKVLRLKENLDDIMDAKNMAQNAIDVLQGECLVLRKENDDILKAKKKHTLDLIEAQNEIQTLNQRKLEAEHQLQTSRFREKEAVEFLRHFRRFYHRLLSNVNAQGSGILSDTVSHMVAAPSLSDLSDIDKFLVESGILERNEIGRETDTDRYQPSKSAMLKSSTEASNVKRSIQSNHRRSKSSDFILQLENARTAIARSLSGPSMSGYSSTMNTVTTSELSSSGPDDISKCDLQLPSSVEISHRPSNPKSIKSSVATDRKTGTPASRLSEKCVEDLEKEVLNLTKRCIDLQTSLNNAEDLLDIANSKRKNHKKIQSGKEMLELKEELRKKSADLEGALWKLNELQFVNQSYNSQLSQKEEQIAYLEDSLRSLQDKNWKMVSDQFEKEHKHRAEVERLNSIIESLTMDLWQDGKSKLSLDSRIIVPFQGSTTNSKAKSNKQNINRGIGSSFEKKSPKPQTVVQGQAPRSKQKYVAKRENNHHNAGRTLATRQSQSPSKSSSSKFTGRNSLTTSPIRNVQPRSPSSISRSSSKVNLGNVNDQLNRLDVLTRSWRNNGSTSMAAVE
jgi:DNA repair exonuclease SbcCD ATPase subunit